MLFVPEGDPTFRILSIDPGSDTLGVAVLELNLKDNQLTLVHAETYSGKRLAMTEPFYIEAYGERVARLLAHESNLYELLETWQPHCIISEAPFLGRFPQAFAALTECFMAIRRAVGRYNEFLDLESIDPVSVKKAVGVKAKGTDKTDMSIAVQGLKDLNVLSHIRLEDLDEHSIDAVAVGYYRYLFMLGRYL